MLTKKDFGTLKNGESAKLYRIENESGAYVEFTNYGCKITKIVVPDKNSNMINVCLGYDTLEEYELDKCFLGTAVGRYANRIAKGEFEIDGVKYIVDKNEGNNHLHGGFVNFANCVWEEFESSDNEVVFTKEFKDMEGGYPGNLKVYISYAWDDDNKLDIRYKATSDKNTVINLTNHSYFNLTGDYKNTILDHELTIYTDKYTPTDEEWIPTGEIASVIGTPFDFTNAHKIGERIKAEDEQLRIGKGYDHNYVFGNYENKLMAKVYCEVTGITMECYSVEPGMQLYTGNNLVLFDEAGDRFKLNTGLCLETQNYPDAPNKKEFPSAILEAGKEYSTITSYVFSC